MYNYYIFDLARKDQQKRAQESIHAYRRLPTAEASLVQRAILSVRALLSKNVDKDDALVEVANVDN